MKATHIIRHVIAGFLLTHSIARAVTLTDQSELSPTNTLINFDTIPSGLQTNPLMIGNATFSSSAQLALYNVNGGGYNPPPNLVSQNTLLSNNTGTLGDTSYVSIRIDFASPVSEIGFAWWDSTFGSNLLEVYSASSVLLETASFPGGVTGGNGASFRGIHRGGNEIAFAIAQWSAPNDLGGIDNVSYGQVPEPSSAMLALASSLLFLRRRRNA